MKHSNIITYPAKLDVRRGETFVVLVPSWLPPVVEGAKRRDIVC